MVSSALVGAGGLSRGDSSAVFPLGVLCAGVCVAAQRSPVLPKDWWGCVGRRTGPRPLPAQLPRLADGLPGDSAELGGDFSSFYFFADCDNTNAMSKGPLTTC